MEDFRQQIMEDIRDYQEKYPNIENINKDEWAFNFWILDKLYSEDEDMIVGEIIDYNDKGIDCYVWHEDLHDLYLIQNKYYTGNSKITNNYVQNDFLTRSIGALEKGTYSRSRELQDIYNKYHDEEDFTIHFNFYVTNNNIKTQEIEDGLATFNQKHKNYIARIFDLDDIEELYYCEPKVDKKSMSFEIKSINKGTVLNINTEAYKMTQALDAKYILTPITVIYDMVKKSKEEEYPIFNANIREYLGATGSTNKGIMTTLKDPEERKNFFYYNNGITIIANDIGNRKLKNKLISYEITDPQIVNGCQTVSTIYETLNSLPQKTLEEDFKDTYIMAKVLKIPSKDETLTTLYKDIVKYNNSQNKIDPKTFEASAPTFKRVKEEFKNRGLLVCIKQSDDHKYKEEYKEVNKLLDLNLELLDKYGIDNRKKASDFIINLEKFLQVCLAFCDGVPSAIQKKSNLLKRGTEENTKVVNFIKDVTFNNLVDLYLLYMRAEQEKKNSESGRMPIPLYLICCLAVFECQNDGNNISKVLSTKEDVNKIIKLYTLTLTFYYNQWKKKNEGKEYNDMIKSQLDMELLRSARESFEEIVKID